MLTILFFGDIQSKLGREAVKKELPKLKKQFKPNFIMANGENLSHGRGISLKTFDEMQEAGIEFFTTGNHIWDKKQAEELLEQDPPKVIRPANFPKGNPGRGDIVVEIGKHKLLIVNIQGQAYFKNTVNSPFKTIDQILKDYKDQDINGILVDFHAETTSEKKAMGWYLDGKVSAILGTHTHVQTADETIMPKGTGYITDIGMVGGVHSVIGLAVEPSIEYFLNEETKVPHDFPESGETIINAVLLKIDPKTAKTKEIHRINNTVVI